MSIFDNITKTYMGNGTKNPNPTNNPNNNKNNTKKAAPAPANNGKAKKPKKKLHPVAVILIVVGGIGAVTPIATIAVVGGVVGVFKLKDFINLSKYQSAVNSEVIAANTIEDIIDKDETSMDELLDQDREQYDAYENFSKLLNARRQFIEPKDYIIKSYGVFECDYNDITYERIDELNSLYYQYYAQMEKCKDANSEEYKEAKKYFDSVCMTLNSMGYAIDEYEKQYGQELVKDIANKVFVSKVVDEKNLDPIYVSNINGKYGDNGTIKISFDYNDGDKTSYTTNFKNQKTEKVEYIAKDISNDNLLDAIHETKILAIDDDYDNFNTKQVK